MKNFSIFITAFLISVFFLSACAERKEERAAWTKVTTFAGLNREFGEPFGLAIRDDFLYVSDGEQGKIWRVLDGGKTELVTDKLNTPSAIAFDAEGFLIVADSGSHTIKKVDVTNLSLL